MSEDKNKRPALTQDEIDMVALSHLMKAFHRITASECKKGETLIFQFGRRLPYTAKKNLMRNFDVMLAKHGLIGLFLPEDVNLVGMLSHCEDKQREAVLAAAIGNQTKEQELEQGENVECVSADLPTGDVVPEHAGPT